MYVQSSSGALSRPDYLGNKTEVECSVKTFLWILGDTPSNKKGGLMFFGNLKNLSQSST